MDQIENILQLGKSYLTSGWSTGKSAARTSRISPELVFDHSVRVLATAKRLLHDPEIPGKTVDELVLTAAAVLHDTAWVDMVKTGQIQATEIFCRPVDAEFCRRSAQIACDLAGGILPGRTLDKIVQAISEMKAPRPSLPDALLLADADNLEDFGLLGLTRQIRMAQATGKSTGQILETWHRQQEYHYWEARIKNALHLNLSKAIAARRLENMGKAFDLLRREIEFEDVETPERLAVGEKK